MQKERGNGQNRRQNRQASDSIPKGLAIAEGSNNNNQQKLTHLINFIIQQNSQVSPQISAQINTVFQLLLWAERRSPQILINALEMGLLQQIMILQVQSDHGVLGFIKGVTLLFGNCVQGGIIITHLLVIGYGDQVFKNAIAALNMRNNCDPDQLVQYFGSYLKAYAKHLSQSTLQHYCRQTKCLLAEVCCNFHNCPQELTRTAVMNILLTVFGFEKSKQFLERSKNLQQNEFLKWAFIFTVEFRNQLMHFDQDLKNCSKASAQRKIQQINDTVILWEDLTAVPHSASLFRKCFLSQILHPLLAGSMSKQLRPVFSLKFCLMMLGKLLPVFKNLDLLEQVAQILFLGMQFTTHNSKMAVINFPSSFDIFKVASRSVIQENFNYIKQLTGINDYVDAKDLSDFFLAVLKSRDNQFICLICTLIMNFLQLLRKQNKNRNSIQSDFLWNLFNLEHTKYSKTYCVLLQILLNQLHAPHSLKTLMSISRTIVHFQIKSKKRHRKGKNKLKNDEKSSNKLQRFQNSQKSKADLKIQRTKSEAIQPKNKKSISDGIASKIWQNLSEGQTKTKTDKLSDSFQRRWNEFAELQKREFIDIDELYEGLGVRQSKSNSQTKQKQKQDQTTNKQNQQIQQDNIQSEIQGKQSFSPSSQIKVKQQTNQNQSNQVTQKQKVQLKQLQNRSSSHQNKIKQSYLQSPKRQTKVPQSNQSQQGQQNQKDSPTRVNYLQHDQKNKMIFLFRSLIADVKKIISQKQSIEYINETLEYDIKAVEALNFVDALYKNKMQELLAQVDIFCQNVSSQNLGDYIPQQELPFYQSIPDTPQDSTRYKLAKFLLIRKLRYVVIESNDDLLSQTSINRQSTQSFSQSSSLLNFFYRNVLRSEGSIFKPGQVIRLSQIKKPFHPCKLIEKKDQINVALIDDDNALIIGFIQQSKKSLKLMMNIKIKHVSSQVRPKGANLLLDIIVKVYNHQKQRVIYKSSFALRGFEMGTQYIPNKREKFRDKQTNFLLRLIKRCENDIPEISLI